MNPERIVSKSLRASSVGHIASDILVKAIDAVDPEKAVAQYLHREGSELLIGKKLYDLNQLNKIFLIGFGIYSSFDFLGLAMKL